MPIEKPKKYLILTSSGGAGHLSAADAQKKELETQIKAGKIPPGEIDVIDIMGMNKSIATNTEAWVKPYFKGPFGQEYFTPKETIEEWEEVFKQGGKKSIQKLEKVVKVQWIAEAIQYEPVYTKMKEYLKENDVQEIYDTQALLTPAICQAITEVNKEDNRKLHVTKIVTEYLTHKAVHFLTPLSKIKPEHSEVLTVQVVKPPFCGPGETIGEFFEAHGIQQKTGNTPGIKFDFSKAAPVRRDFIDNDFNKSKQIIIKAKTDEVVDKDNQIKFKKIEDDQSIPASKKGEAYDKVKETREQEFLKKTLGESATNTGNEFTINKKEGDKLFTITMGSQGSATVLQYVDKFIDQAIEAGSSKGKNGNVYLAIVAGKNEGTKAFYTMIQEHIAKRKAELEVQGKTIPDSVKILPLAYQDGKHMASLHHNSDIIISRSGGMSSIEVEYTQEKNKARKVYVHSEETVSPTENFPSHSYDARYERLIGGIIKWEGGNAEYLMKNIGASLGSPDTINYGLSGDKPEQTLDKEINSLFHAAYNGQLNSSNVEQIKNLIYEGSNPNLKLPDGSSLIEHCKDFETMQLLVQHGAKLTETAVHKAIDNGILNKEQLIQLKNDSKKFPKDFQHSQSNTAVHHAFADAIKNGDIKKIQGILYHFDKIKDDPIKVGNTKFTPLQYAVECNQPKVLESLISKGAKHDSKTLYNLLDGKGKEYQPMLELLVRNKTLNPLEDKLPHITGNIVI